MSTLKTKLSVQQIQLALHDSFLFDQRSSVIVPNISWGMLPYEADLIGISKSGQVTEVEIKRSLSDLRADYKKGHRHDAPCVTYFYYCVPESLVKQAKKVILEIITFSQAWSSTALGFGGFGGQAITTANTTVVRLGNGLWHVFFGSKLAYVVENPTKEFHEDLLNRRMVDCQTAVKRY